MQIKRSLEDAHLKRYPEKRCPAKIQTLPLYLRQSQGRNSIARADSLKRGFHKAKERALYPQLYLYTSTPRNDIAQFLSSITL